MALLNKIPATLIDYAVYLGGNRLIGVGEVTLPSITAQTADVQGAGISGKVEMPVIGHFDAMTLKINFRTIETDAARLMAPGAHDLTLRAAQQVYEGALGSMKVEPLTIQARCVTKANELGKLMGGESPDGSVELEVLRLRVVKGGIELLEIDKLNNIFRVMGVDYSATVRAALGIDGGFGAAGAIGLASDAASVIDLVV